MNKVLKRIDELRLERNWTEYRLAEKSGLTQSTISSWYRRNHNPSIESLERICDGFDITLSYFFKEEDSITDETTEIVNEIMRLSKEQRKALLEFLRIL